MGAAAGFAEGIEEHLLAFKMDVLGLLEKRVLADHAGEKTISLLAISASHLGDDPFPQLEVEDQERVVESLGAAIV